MEASTRPARYQTLRDYLRVLRRYRIAILVVAILGAAVGYISAQREQPVYQSTAVVEYQDVSETLSLVGLTGQLGNEAPAELAAEDAETINRPAIVDAVNQALHGSETADHASVSAQVSIAGLLEITTKATDANFAARVSNAVADAVVAQSNTQIRSKFQAAAADIRLQVATLDRHPTANATEIGVDQDELARLDTLSRFAHSASVTQPAAPNPQPVSPKKTRSTILGFVLGLLLAIALAFLADALDRRLRTQQDISDTFGLPLLGHVRRSAMGKVTGPSPSATDAEKLDLEAYRILRRNVEFLNFDNPPRIIVVTSATPEEGKTTVATSLACAAASAGKRALLVECDLRRPVLARRMDLEGSPGLVDYLAGEAEPAQILRTVALDQGDASNNGRMPTDAKVNNLVCIPAGAPAPRAAELLASQRFRSFVQDVTSVYEFIVIDTSPVLPVVDTLEILPLADAIVLCVRAEKTTRDVARATEQVLERFRDVPSGIVITDVKPNTAGYEAYEYSYTGYA